MRSPPAAVPPYAILSECGSSEHVRGGTSPPGGGRMEDQDRTREQLLDEVRRLRADLARWERADGERRQALEALRRSEECHRAICELTSDYAYIARLEAGGRAVIEWASDGFRKVTGYTVEEAEAQGGW